MTQNRWFIKNALQELVKSTQAQILTLQTEPCYDFFISVVLLLPPVCFFFFLEHVMQLWLWMLVH